MLAVEVWPTLDAADEDVLKFDVEYVSFVTAGTHGPPALVAPGRESGKPVPTVAKATEKVLYINNSLVPLFTIERLTDPA